MAASSPAKPPPLIGKYEILARIGYGGMSTVYKARDLRTAKIVALKVASKSVAESLLATKRFATEYKILQPLNHPNLVKVLDYGDQNGTPYLVMEYMAGRTLADLIKLERQLDEKTACTIVMQIADVLEYLHGQQIIHRDVKPANILFDEHGRAMLADLGLGKDLDSRSGMTRSRVGLGTLQFSSPEQIRDARNVDRRSDVYGLAATLYVAVTGDVPFGTRGPVHVLQRKMKNQFDAPLEKNPGLSSQFDAAIRSGLQADRDSRPATCLAFAALLTGETATPPVSKLSGAMPLPTLLPKKTSKPPGRERRATPRYHANLESTCRPVGSSKQQSWPVMIKDISSTGVCLHIKRRFEVGNLLDLIFVMDRDGSTTTQIVRVRRVNQLENTWQLGCEFINPLDQHDLDCFLHDRMHVTAQINT